MNNQEALNTLNDIRNMMEKSTRFVSFSGLSSIVIGIYACIAAIIAYSILGNTTPVPQQLTYQRGLLEMFRYEP